MLCAARKAIGTANINENIVPSVAIFRVSQIGSPNCAMYSQRGGVARVQISSAIRGASHTKNHVVELDIFANNMQILLHQLAILSNVKYFHDQYFFAILVYLEDPELALLHTRPNHAGHIF